MDYKKEIIEMINGIKKTGTLEYLYTFIKLDRKSVGRERV